jgi:hypothetical protein
LNWQVLDGARQSPSTQMSLPLQSAVERHAPAGTQVSRKSQTKPAVVQSVSALQVPDGAQAPSAQYAPTAQSPSVRQGVTGAPGTQTLKPMSQTSPLGQSLSRTQLGASSHTPPRTSQRKPSEQSSMASHGQPSPTQKPGPLPPRSP